MSMSSIPSSSPGGKRYGWVEKIGNKVPHPFLLFIYLIVALIAATAILSAFNVGVQNPTDGSRVVVKNLLSVEGLHWFLPNVIKNFSGFAPLGAILALVLGAGFAERVGLLPALMVKMASHVSARYASYMVLFIAFFSHISSDAALVIMPPLGALMFLAVGRASCRRPVGGDCRCGLRLYRQFTDCHHRRTALGDQHRGGKIHRCLFARQRDRQLVLYGDLGDRSDARRRTDHR
ncbi:p-aminobenzoyl-glutamate transporter AbgT [Klebsiella variicola]|nr:p-aminobenzoyl-glutamate transporter AbgT [Klebsiella variicola]